MIEIFHRDGRLLYAARDAGTIRDAVEAAVSRRVDLSGAILDDADLGSINLEEAKLVGASLVRANLRSANLEEIYLTRADLTEARLDGANLERADFVRGAMPHLHSATTTRGHDQLAVG